MLKNIERGERGGKSVGLEKEYRSRQAGDSRQGNAGHICGHGGGCKGPYSSRRFTRGRKPCESERILEEERWLGVRKERTVLQAKLETLGAQERG